MLRMEVLDQYPHDTAAFTQGLELRDGVLYESTGLYGESSVRIVEVETGQVLEQVDLPPAVFGEGLTLVGDRIWQLTWQEGVAFHRDRDTLEELGQVRYEGEGWGLCHDADRGRLIMSDGSSQLTFRDPTTFAVIGSVEVTRDGVPVTNLNELECVGSDVWANIWYEDEIIKIDPDRGAVTAVVDASQLLLPEEAIAADVLNGIAATSTPDELLITGKLWPHTFRVRFTP